MFDKQAAVVMWARQQCDVGSSHHCLTSVLLHDFNAWLDQCGVEPLTADLFWQSVVNHIPGTAWRRSRRGMVLEGIGLRNAT